MERRVLQSLGNEIRVSSRRFPGEADNKCDFTTANPEKQIAIVS